MYNQKSILQFNIDKYEDSNLRKILYIFRLNIPEYFAPSEEQDFKNYLRSDSKKYFTIRYKGHIAGGAGFRIDETGRVGSISWIFLHPDYVGNGLGKKAVTFLLELLSEMKTVEVLRTETSQHAYKFFGSFGFTTVKKEKEYWGKGLDLYRMEMRKSDFINQ